VSITVQDRQFSAAIATRSVPVGAGGVASSLFNHSLAMCKISFHQLYDDEGQVQHFMPSPRSRSLFNHFSFLMQLIEGSFSFAEVLPACEESAYRAMANNLQALASSLQSSSSLDYRLFSAHTSLYTLR
jgi:hypothetical protein